MSVSSGARCSVVLAMTSRDASSGAENRDAVLAEAPEREGRIQPEACLVEDAAAHADERLVGEAFPANPKAAQLGWCGGVNTSSNRRPAWRCWSLTVWV